MLKRVRIEVEEHDPIETAEALLRYEHALVMCEVERYGLARSSDSQLFVPWSTPREERDWYALELHPQVTDEVISFMEPGYHTGRRVVMFQRVDTRDGVYQDREDVEWIGSSALIRPTPTS
jgi:hypothetical protein